MLGCRTGRVWKVLLYMGWGNAGKFEREQADVLNTIATTAELDHVEFVYQFARRGQVERGRIRHKRREVLSTSPPINITNPTHLTHFIDWADETFPSRYTALFAKDHGQGSINRAFQLAFATE